MKVLIKILVLSLLTTLFVSCGSKPTTANLKISSSFLMSNSSYNGGIILRGKSSADQHFTLSIPVSGGSTNEATLELPKGNWTFYAAAWDGTGAFQGNALCGETQATLLNDVATVQIVVNQMNCNSGTFSGSYSSVTASAGNAYNTAKLFSLSSCGAFYIGNTPVVNGNTASYCDSGMASDMKSKVKSFRIKAPNRTLNNVISAGFQSTCYNAGASSVINAANVRLPSKNIPFIFEIFEKPGCQDLIADHPFLEGMEFNYPNVDKLFLSAAGGLSLHLPSNEIKKGYSPFYHILPSFKCAGADCVPHAAGYDYYAKRNATISVEIDRVAGANCVDYALASSPAATFSGIASISCSTSTNSDQVMANITVQAHPTNCTDANTAPVNLCWTQTSLVDFRFSIVKGGATTYKVVHVFLNDKKFESIRLAWENIGKSYGAPKIVDINNNNNNSDKDENYDGALSFVRDMLGPNGAGGLFGTANTSPTPAICNSINESKIITFKNQEKQQNETYQVIVGPANYFVPNTLPFFCNTASYGSCASQNTTYDKRLRAYKLYGPGDYRLQIAINFSCSTEAGVMMDVSDEIKDDGRKNISKKVIAWTTPVANSAFQRFEHYSLNKDFDTNGTLTNVYTNLVRVQKDSVDGSGNTYQVDGVRYSQNYDNNLTTYNENATRFFQRGDPGFLAYEGFYSSKSGITSGSPNVFTDSGAFATNRELLSKTVASTAWEAQINPQTLNDTTSASWAAVVGESNFQLGFPALPTGIGSADPALMDSQIFNYLKTQANPLFQ